jgi:hypothetical protein
MVRRRPPGRGLGTVGRETFPSVLFAGAFGFTEAALFEVKAESEREAPKVSFQKA